MRGGARDEKTDIFAVVQPPYVGFPGRDILYLVEEQILLLACRLGMKFLVRSHNQVELAGLDGKEAVILEIEVQHLVPIHALGL